MPRRKRNIKSKKCNTIYCKENTHSGIDVPRACVDNNSLNCSKKSVIVTNLENQTPSPNLQIDEYDEISIKTTPTTSQKDVSINENLEFNFTNLALLFNSGKDLSVFSLNDKENIHPNKLNRSTQTESNDIPSKKRCLNDAYNAKKHLSENDIVSFQNCNLNPYVNYKKESFKKSDNSRKSNIFGDDVSFFTPEILQIQPTSTPINLFPKNVGFSHSTPKMPSISVNYRPFKMKLKNTGKKTKPPKRLSTSSNVSRKLSVGVSVRQLSTNISKKTTSRRFSTASSTDNAGSFQYFFKKMFKLKQAVSNWTTMFFEMFNSLGITLKNLLSNVNFSKKSKKKECKNCNCSVNKKQMDEISSKFVQLDKLPEDIKKLITDVEELKTFRNEFQKFKEQMKKPDILAPPPPPPPPAPPMPLVLTPAPRPNLSKVKKSNKSETLRPVITLDDILKVKLKKTGDRPTPIRRSSSSQPTVSLEMLQQVKLKPPSRPMTPCSLPMGKNSEGPMSPSSSLKKILKDDSSSRVKRLRRKGPFIDDVYKRNLLKRERD